MAQSTCSQHLLHIRSQQTNHKHHQAIERTKEFDPETYHMLKKLWRCGQEVLVAARRCSFAGQLLVGVWIQLPGHHTKPNWNDCKKPKFSTKHAPATMPWDEEAGKPASFSDPPRTPLTLLTQWNVSAGCMFWVQQALQDGDQSIPHRAMGSKEAPLPCLAVLHCCPTFWTTVAMCGQRCLCSQFPCIKTTWEAPMQSVGMCGEPEYDVEKFGEAAEATV